MISRTRWQTLVAVALVVGVVTWLLMHAMYDRGATLPEVSWLVGGVELVIAAVVFVMGWHVRQYLRGKRPSLDPIRAARTAVLAKAACYTGALLVGWYGGQLTLRLTQLGDVANTGERAWAAALAALGAVAMLVVGLVVEAFCRIPPAEPDAEKHPTTPTHS